MSLPHGWEGAGRLCFISLVYQYDESHFLIACIILNNYFRKGMLPAPDIYYTTYQGERPGWHIDTVERWMNNRPGSGRTYAAMKRHPSNNSTKENN